MVDADFPLPPPLVDAALVARAGLHKAHGSDVCDGARVGDDEARADVVAVAHDAAHVADGQGADVPCVDEASRMSARDRRADPGGQARRGEDLRGIAMLGAARVALLARARGANLELESAVRRVEVKDGEHVEG